MLTHYKSITIMQAAVTAAACIPYAVNVSVQHIQTKPTAQ